VCSALIDISQRIIKYISNKIFRIRKILKKIILATGSVDRREIFERANLSFTAISSDVDESSYKKNIKDPLQLVQRLAKEKVLDVKKKLADTSKDVIIIGADTIVEYKGEIIGKAKNEQNAFNILKKLMGKTHNLITGLAINQIGNDKVIIEYDITRVEFLPLPDNDIKKYIALGEWKGRAGAYSLRERASLFIKSVNGSPSTVLGLPMQRVFQILKNILKINLLEYSL
jgi:septum formation protein